MQIYPFNGRLSGGLSDSSVGMQAPPEQQFAAFPEAPIANGTSEHPAHTAAAIDIAGKSMAFNTTHLKPPRHIWGHPPFKNNQQQLITFRM